MIANSEAEVSSLLVFDAYFSALPWDPQHQWRPRLQMQSWDWHMEDTCTHYSALLWVARMGITQLSVETHNMHRDRGCNSEAVASSPLVNDAHFSVLPWDPQHQWRPWWRIPRWGWLITQLSLERRGLALLSSPLKPTKCREIVVANVIQRLRLGLRLSRMFNTLHSLETHSIHWGRGCGVRGWG